ncbi:MAG: N-acetyl sugar amidotransferase [Bacteroidota bacterium]
MKKALILAYDFPPYVSVGGLRPYNWYKYLHLYGVEPTVVTRQWSNENGNHLDYISKSEMDYTIIEKSELGSIIRTSYAPNFANRLMLKYGESKFRLLRKSVSGYFELIQWLSNSGPKSQLYFAAKNYLKENKVDVIIATGDPFILFKYASKLSKEFEIPWIADYRDPWTHNKSNSKNLFLKIWNYYFEKKIVNTSTMVITVSDFVKIKIKDVVNTKRFSILPNGYNPEAIEGVNEETHKNDELNISFAGTSYKWHPLESFLAVISTFISQNPTAKLKLNFYGINNAEDFRKIINTQFPQIKRIINVFPKTQNNLLLKELAKSQLMLLFNDYSIIGTKIFDYIGIKRVILLCYANDRDALKLKEKYYTVDEVQDMSNHLQEELINQTNSGYVVQDASHLLNLLNDLYLEFNQNGFIKCNTINAEQYSRKAQTGELAKIIKELAVDLAGSSVQRKSEELSIENESLINGEESKGRGEREVGQKSNGVTNDKLQGLSSQSSSSFHDESSRNESFHEKSICHTEPVDVHVSSYQQCTRCVMDTSDVDIRFDEKGVCNHCTNYFERIANRVYQGEKSDDELLQIIAKIKKSGKGKEYDCVIGVSGGIDSSYVAYKAKKRGLRPLLVHLDNGWNSEISVKNIKNLANILGFDYQSFVLDWEEFRDIQLAFLRASIPEMETPTDIAIPGALHQVAAKYGIKYIISGGNFATEGILPKTWHYNAKDFKYFKHIQKTFGTKKIKKFPFFGWKEEAYYKLVKGIKMVYLLNYVPYNKQEAMQILQDELGWRYYGGKHYESKYTGFVQSYIMPEKFNMDYRRATLATQICTGEVSREFALEELTHKSYDAEKSNEEKEYVCKKLGITTQEFDKIMGDSAKIYRDYPNAEKNLEFIYNIYRKTFGKPSYKED